MKLACSSKIAPGDTYRQKLANLERLGFEGIEVRILMDDLSPHLLDEIEAALAESTVKVSSVIVPGTAYQLPFDSLESKNAKLEGSKKALEVSARLGGGAFITPEYKPQSSLPLWEMPKPLQGEERRLFLEFLSEIGEYAERLATIALLEPINRYETHFYHNIADVRAIIDEVGSSRIKMAPDFFHMNLEERDIAASLESAAGYIHHIQLGDSNRQLPGQGHTDFTSGFAALQRIGYDRYMALECRLPKDAERELTECVRFLHKCLAEAEASNASENKSGA